MAINKDGVHLELYCTECHDYVGGIVVADDGTSKCLECETKLEWMEVIQFKVGVSILKSEYYQVAAPTEEESCKRIERLYYRSELTNPCETIVHDWNAVEAHEVD